MSQHITRCVRILSMLSNGQALSTAEMQQRLQSDPDQKQVTVRQIQRDLQAIEAAGVPLTMARSGSDTRWYIPHHARVCTPPSIEDHEILSLHVLKGSLGLFRNTSVGADVERLLRKLERVAPGTVFMSPDIVSEVSPGQYATSVSESAMRSIVAAIVDPHWDRVTYRSVNATTPKTYVVSFCRLINHAGRLYVAAWHPGYQRYITLAADRIDHVERANDVTDPIHEFDEALYRSGRFGVYDGDIADITLRIDASAAAFFMARTWHPSQTFTTLRNGRVDLQLRAPLSPELVSWIVSWADVLHVRSPKKLREMCHAKVQRITAV